MLTDVTRQKPRILIVDDEEINRFLLMRILQNDYDIDVAENGQECLNHLMQQNYDAVLLDLMMPVLNGIETLKIIREELDLSTLPIIIVSAKSDNDTIVEGIELGANDFIPKPIDTRIVLARLKTQVQLKQLSDDHKRMAQELEEANNVKVRMMQIASHDLKNPLNNLALMLTVLQDIVGPIPELPNFMELANQNIETMVQIIDDFLEANDCLIPDLRIDIRPESSQKIVRNTVAQYKLAADDKRIKMIYQSDHDVRIMADRDRIMQVISNLISNAIKYTPQYGAVTVRSFVKKNVWRLEVQDTGAGIPEKERQHLFTAFSKHNISTKPTDGETSTGLGLWIAAEMIQLQNGTIGMDSPDDGGCCFWIELPLSDSAILSLGA